MLNKRFQLRTKKPIDVKKTRTTINIQIMLTLINFRTRLGFCKIKTLDRHEQSRFPARIIIFVVRLKFLKNICYFEEFEIDSVSKDINIDTFQNENFNTSFNKCVFTRGRTEKNYYYFLYLNIFLILQSSH